MATTEQPPAIELHSAQYECWQSPALYRGFVGGRGAGKSFLGGFDLCMRAKPGRLYMGANPTYPNLRDTTIRTFEEVAGKRLGVLKNLKAGSNPSAVCLATKENGGGEYEVIFRSASDPESLRGPNLSGVWLDEASLMAKAAFDIVIACLREGGELGWLLATYTPKGRGSWTHRQFRTGMPDSACFRAMTKENPFGGKELDAKLRQQYSERFILQELEAESLDEGGTAVSRKDLEACMLPECLWPNEEIPMPAHHALPIRHECYMGVDVGRSRDRSVIWVWERQGDLLFCRVLKVMHDTPFRVQQDAIQRWLRTGLVVKCFIDPGFNPQLAEDAHAAFPGIVEGLPLGTGTQGRLAQVMDNAFSKRAVRVPFDSLLLKDFDLVKAPEVRNGKIVVVTERDLDVGHADRFWACALALDAALHHQPIRTARPYATPPEQPQPQRQQQDVGPPAPEVRRVGRPYFG